MNSEYTRRDIGRFLDSMNPTNFELAPYGEMTIAHQIGTVSLVNCTVPKIHLVTGSQVSALNLSSALPVNGHVVKIRNPYGISIKGQLLFDLPMQIFNQPSEASVQFADNTSWYATADVEADPFYRTGFAFVAKRGVHSVTILGHALEMTVHILPKVNWEMFGKITENRLQNDLTPFYSNGQPADNIVGRYGTYADWVIAQWQNAADWRETPLPISFQDASVTVRCDTETGVFVSYPADSSKPRFSVHGRDVGENF